MTDLLPARALPRAREPADPRPRRRVHDLGAAPGARHGRCRRRSAPPHDRPGRDRRPRRRPCGVGAPRDARRAGRACGISSTTPAPTPRGCAPRRCGARSRTCEWPYRADRRLPPARTVLELPVVSGDPAWHLTEAPVRVWDDGRPDRAGCPATRGSTVRGSMRSPPARTEPVVLVCEARQVGEALVAAGRAGSGPRHPDPPHDARMPRAGPVRLGFADGCRVAALVRRRRPLRRRAVAHAEPAAGCRAARGERHPLVCRSAPGSACRRRARPRPCPAGSSCSIR